MIRRVLAVLALAYLLGFAAFMLLLPRPLEHRVTDAIVVPTGGANRIMRGLELLQAHAARRLLISGVAPEVRPEELAAEYRTPAALFACCVDLGHQAVDTRSNAEETAAWVRAHGYRSVRLVTSDWHMARARMELAAMLDGDVMVLSDGVSSDPRPSQLVTEYNKLILRRIALWLGMGS